MMVIRRQIEPVACDEPSVVILLLDREETQKRAIIGTSGAMMFCWTRPEYLGDTSSATFKKIVERRTRFVSNVGLKK